MARKNLIRTNEYYYHITTRSNHKLWFQIPLSYVWQISINAFNTAQKKHPATVAQYVLMTNHYHLLIQTPNCDIDKFMYFFNKEFSRQLRILSKLENRMFGSNYKWSLITSHLYLKNVFCYIYQNPVRAGLAGTCEQYPYSTLCYSVHNLLSPFPFHPIEELECQLDLINSIYCEDSRQIIKKGLMKSTFKPVYKKC